MAFPLQILGLDHIEFAVSDLEAAADWCLRLGFEEAGSRSIPERKLKSLVMVQQDVRFVLSQSESKTDRIGQFLETHGDGVLSVGLQVTDATTALEVACARGAQLCTPPKTILKDFGEVQVTSIYGVGDVRYAFVARTGDLFLEGFDAPFIHTNPGVGISRVSHLYATVEKGELDAITRFHESVFGWHVLREWDWEGDGRTQRLRGLGDSLLSMTLAEPTLGNPPARDFLEINHGAGIQGILLDSENMDGTRNRLIDAEVGLLPSPNELHLATVPLVGALNFEFRAPTDELPSPSLVNHFLRCRTERSPP